MSKRFMKLSDLQAKDGAKGGGGSGSDDSGDESKPPRSDRDGQSFYVGGSEHSGQQVLGPPGRKPEELVDKLFKEAKKAGAEAVTDETSASGAQQRAARGRAFGGAGLRLDGTQVGGTTPTNQSVDSEASSQGQAPRTVNVLFRLWQNGFSLDDGPLRDYNDPASQRFMASIQRGQIPAELTAAHPECEIDLRMERRVGEEYKPPPMKPFGGQGNRLGSYVPGEAEEVVVIAEVPAAAAAAASSSTPEVPPEPKLNVDESQPKGHVQVRLPSGKAVKIAANASHTVGNIRQALCEAIPTLGMEPFVFMSSYPKRQIEDEGQSLGDAQLLNSVLIVRVVK